MGPVNVVVLAAVQDAALGQIGAVSPDVTVIDARGWFDEELRAGSPAWRNRGGNRAAPPPTSRKQRDAALAGAEVILVGFPVPRDLRARSPRLRWVHQTPAGASNLLRTDLWGSDVLVTTSRGQTDTRRPYAEYVLGGLLHVARGFPFAHRDQAHHSFAPQDYRPLVLEGKTVCILGAGGIGQAVGELCAAAGMRVVGTRRTVALGAPLPAGFDRLEPADRLLALLPESDAVVVCCQWTRETTNLIGPAAFASMKPGAILVNVARGEIIDEAALIAALDAGTLRGVVLDVYVGEFTGPPNQRLWDDPRVLITPHVSGGSDAAQSRPIDLFCDNLRAYLAERPLSNVIDWDRGY